MTPHRIFLCIAGIFVFSSILIFTLLEEKHRKVINYVPAKHSASYIVPRGNGGGSVDYIHISAGNGGDNLPAQLWPVTEDIAISDAGGGGQGGVGGKAFVLLPVNE